MYWTNILTRLSTNTKQKFNRTILLSFINTLVAFGINGNELLELFILLPSRSKLKWLKKIAVDQLFY